MDLEAEQGAIPSYTIVPDARDESKPTLTDAPEKKWEQTPKSYHDVLMW